MYKNENIYDNDISLLICNVIFVHLTKAYSKIEMVQYPLLSPSYFIGKEKGRGKQLRKSVSQ